MKVLLVTQYFYPENFKSNDIAFELVKRGYEVTVLTGIPNYPQGCFFQGYGLFSKKMEKVQGVKIRRAWLFPRGKGGGGRLALNYFSWAFFASFYAFFLSLFHKYDVVLVHEPSPITQGIPAIIIKKMQRIPVYFWVLDLWPESLISAGGVTNKYVISFFTKIVKWIYDSSDKILISSKGFRQSILEKGDFESKLVYFPNWAEDIFSSFCEYSLPQLPDGFIVMFAGNMGEAQDLENVMRGALKLKENKDVKFVFVGDGRKKAWVDDFIQKNSLADTVFTLGRYPLEMMPSFFSKADVMLLSLKSEIIFNLTVPAKLQTYMASGKPILAMINGEGENIVREVNCGLTAKAGDSGQLAEAIMQLKRMPFEKRMQLGKNGQEYYRRNFTLEKCMDNLCHIIQDNQQ
ncbi:glycosyltransferase family 4 protein [Bacteroides fragilis]|uniref:glycosyltransferase family 4 protein n=1 Tax=Bacteroides fragilis TaxID=817 RepID=UPI00202F4A67|nr:glycosyltransferase family 4 protein [Bacteroides fragilis]